MIYEVEEQNQGTVAPHWKFGDAIAKLWFIVSFWLCSLLHLIKLGRVYSPGTVIKKYIALINIT